MTPYRLAGTLLTVSLSACALVDSDRGELAGCVPAYRDVADTVRAQLAGNGVRDAALVVRVGGESVCRLFFGAYTAETRVETISAAKWLTAATIMAVVDAGQLSLQTKVSALFPDAPVTTANITVSQLLSHTSGLLWFSRCMGRPQFTLQACAEQIIEGDLHFEPGTGFYYAGTPFTVAGAMAERATGQPWAAIFRSRIAEPLGLRGTSYGESANPALSEGDVVSTVDDYARFAQMLLDRGMHGRRRVLSEEAVRQMRRDWRGDVEVVFSPRGDVPYGLGAWLDVVDTEGNGRVLSSPGAGGFVPVVDYDRGMVLVLETLNEDVWPAVPGILAAVRTAVDRSR